MRTIARSESHIIQKMNAPFILHRNGMDIKLVNYVESNNVHMIQLGLENINSDNYRIYLKGQYLTLIISEMKEISKPLYIKNVDLDFYYHQGYEVMKSVDIWLPGNNFYLIKHYAVPEEQILKIFLGKSHFN